MSKISAESKKIRKTLVSGKQTPGNGQLRAKRRFPLQFKTNFISRVIGIGRMEGFLPKRPNDKASELALLQQFAFDDLNETLRKTLPEIVINDEFYL